MKTPGQFRVSSVEGAEDATAERGDESELTLVPPANCRSLPITLGNRHPAAPGAAVPGTERSPARLRDGGGNKASLAPAGSGDRLMLRNTTDTTKTRRYEHVTTRLQQLVQTSATNDSVITEFCSNY